MKRILPLLIVFLLFIQSLTLTQMRVGVMAGPQFSIRQYHNSNADNDFITSANAGFVSLVPLSKKISLHGTLGYSGKGVILRDFSFNDGGGYIYAGDINILLHYLELRSPINYTIDLSTKSNLSIGTGPYLSYAVDGRQQLKDNPNFMSFTRKLHFESEYDRFEFGISGNISLQLRKWLLSIYADIGLTDVYKPETSKTINHRSLSITLGYLFWQQKNKGNKK